MGVKGATRSFDSNANATEAPAPRLEPGEGIDGVYRIERLLGEGGSGAVYLVRHEGLDGARFALKVLHAQPGGSSELLSREGRLAALVRSAHVVKVAAIGRLPRGAPYLVMEYVEGSTLDELLGDRDLMISEAVDCGRQLCLALEAAHEQGLVHGDVSLRNVFLSAQPDGRWHVQLGDFGLARRIRRSATATMSVELGGGRGTPRFMAPEVISGDDLDERSDIFSVGVVLYRLLCGAYPFDGESAREIFAATLRGLPVALDERRAGLGALAAVVMGALSSEPAARLGSARELREALEAARDPKLPAPKRSMPRPKKRRTVRTLLVAGAVAVAGVSAWAGVRSFREHARVPIGATLECPDAVVSNKDDADLARAFAQATCARIGTALDIDWGGGTAATRINTRLFREGSGYRVELEVAGRVETARRETPFATAEEVARRLLARIERRTMSPDEIRLWGASDAETAAAVRAVWRRRTVVILDNAEEEPRAVLAKDPNLPLMHALLAEVERDPLRRREARQKALLYAARLPPDRAAALRGFSDVNSNPESVDNGLDLLRQAYSSSPSDFDIGVMYVGALVHSDRAETALAVAEELHARFPRRALLAVHYVGELPERTADEHAQFVEWTLEALPESRGWTANIALLTRTGRLSEAEAASDFARRFGMPEERRLIPEVVLALALGDPARIERASVRLQGSTLSWAQRVGARMRLAALLLLGQTAAAESFVQTQIWTRRTAGEDPAALQDATELLRISRLTNGPALRASELAWMADSLSRLTLPLVTYAAARTELSLAQARTGLPFPAVATILDELDAELGRRAGADALALDAARLRTLPLVRYARGDRAAAARWRVASSTWLDDRVRTAFDAALSLEKIGEAGEAERAYRLASSPYALERHTFESVAARLRLADLLDKQGRSAETRSLMAYVDKAWAGADRGLRETVRGLGAESGPGAGSKMAPGAGSIPGSVPILPR